MAYRGEICKRNVSVVPDLSLADTDGIYHRLFLNLRLGTRGSGLHARRVVPILFGQLSDYADRYGDV